MLLGKAGAQIGNSRLWNGAVTHRFFTLRGLADAGLKHQRGRAKSFNPVPGSFSTKVFDTARALI